MSKLHKIQKHFQIDDYIKIIDTDGNTWMGKIQEIDNESIEILTKGDGVVWLDENEIKDFGELDISDRNKKLDKDATLLFEKGQFEKALDVWQKILSDTTRSKSISTQQNIVLCYINMERYNDAQIHLQEILAIEPKNKFALKWQNNIKNKVTKENALQQNRDITEKVSKKHLAKLLNNNTEKKHSEENNLRQSGEIDLLHYENLLKSGNTRGRKRTEILLKKALLEKDNFSDKKKFKGTLKEYFLTQIEMNIKNNELETIHFWFLEYFRIEKDERKSIELFYQYLYIFLFSNIKLRDTTKDLQKWLELDHPDFYLKARIKKVLKIIFEQKKDATFFYYQILCISSFNKGISNTFQYIYSYEKGIWKKILLFAKEIKLINSTEYVSYENYDIGKEELQEAWKYCLAMYNNSMRNWFIRCLSYTKIKKLEEWIRLLNEFRTNLHQDFLLEIDKKRVLRLVHLIDYQIRNFVLSQDFEDKIRNYNYAITELESVSKDINNQIPTNEAFDVFLPILEHIKKLLEQAYQNLLETSRPRVSLSISSISTHNHKGEVVIQITIGNAERCSPINDIRLSIKFPNEKQWRKDVFVTYDTLKGGNNLTAKLLPIKISSLVTAIQVRCSYNTYDNSIEKTEHNFPLQFSVSKVFQKLENPYAALADGGPVEDKSMFYGRDKFIGRIGDSIMKAKAKCVIIYGQKRSGKSSVLFHLKEYLENSQKAFCVPFSIGEMTSYISVPIFFSKILNDISEHLEDLEEENIDIPEFYVPSLNALKENPNAIFRKCMRNFKKACQKMPYWKDKKLVLMIDEFTYLYSAIIKNELPKDFMKMWKSLIESKLFSAVLIGQDVMPKFKKKFPNEFGVTQDERLTYLHESDAKQLIEEPIQQQISDKTVFVGQAIEEILTYTSQNPYYIQIFCKRLVNYMNDEQINVVTEADVKEVAQTFISGRRAFSIDKFDNLLTAGDAEIEAFEGQHVLTLLKQIARNSRHFPCAEEQLQFKTYSRYNDKDILEDLVTRYVLERIFSNNKPHYKIQVKLFQDWLLNN